MSDLQPHLPERDTERASVRLARGVILATFTVFALSVILWVSHLIRVSLEWNDNPSISLGISIIAVPVFLALLALVQYVYWGLRKHAGDPVDGPGQDHGSHLGLALLVGLASGLLVAGPVRADEPLPANPAVGWSLFVDKGCSTCHAIRGVGGKRASDLGLVELNHSRLDTVGLFWNHGIEMDRALSEMRVARPVFTDVEMERLLAFIYLQTWFDPEAEPGVGERVYQRAACGHCHGASGEGGRAPALASLGTYASPMGLAAAIWNHGPRMSASLRESGLSYPIFSGQELLDLASFLKTGAQPPDSAPLLLELGDPNRGMTLLKAKGCTSCHAAGGRAASRAPIFEETNWGGRAQSDLVAGLWNHGPTMWSAFRSHTGAVPQLTLAEMNDLAMALFFQGFHDAPGDPVAGAQHYVVKGCAACHGPAGRGGSAPPLSGSRALDSDVAAAAAIWNHLPAMASAMTETGQIWPLFKDGEMADLLAFLRQESLAAE